MPRYTIKLNVVMSGQDTIVIDDDREFEVETSITFSPTSTMIVSDGKGGSVTLQPGVSISGTVVKRE